MQQVHAGDRVSWRANPKCTGTIQSLYLHEYPFYVKWDDGKDDWYEGKDLVFLPPTELPIEVRAGSKVDLQKGKVANLGTMKLLALTEKCSDKDRNELLSYVGRLEAAQDRFYVEMERLVKLFGVPHGLSKL